MKKPAKTPHRPNGLIDQLRSEAPAKNKSTIVRANKEAREALAQSKASGPGILSKIPAKKINKLIAHS